ncbi:membrane progestin receptor gamma-B isoform X5 [Siniperca chuatsi]|nr:membrane progestin receptor gamma-B isoform X5 [Siniperca chuatsi]
METSDGGADSDSMAGLLHLASGDLPALLLHLSAGIELCSHLQHHVSAGTPHLLLLRLWCPQFLQPGISNHLFSLCFPGQVGEQLLPPVLHPHRCAQHCPLHRRGLLLQVWLGLPFLQYNHDIVKRFPECQSPKFSKYLRVVAFAYPYLFDNIPLFYRVFLCVGEGCTDNDTNILHYNHIALAFLTGFLFATHLPERLAPGSFDYIGHSHQLFHVCGILGTHFQMNAIEQDMVTRRPWLLEHSIPITFANSVGAALFCVVLNLIIIILYSLPLFSAPVCKEKKRVNGPKKASAKVCPCC